MIEFDVETTGFQWYGHDVFLAQFLADGLEGTPVLRHPQSTERIQQILTNGHEVAQQGFRAWNAKFDLHFLASAGYELPPEHLWHDGMVMAHLLDERKSVALQAVGDRIFGTEAAGADTEKAVKAWLDQETRGRRKASKETGAQFARPNYSDVPDNLMHPYAAHDVELQRRVCDVLEPKLNDELRELYELERGVLAALFWMERRGFPIDRSAAARFEASLLPGLEEAHARCVDLAGIPTFNPDAPLQVAEALKRRGADLTFVTKGKSGALSMDEENLSTVPDELAAAVLKFRGLRKLHTTYLRPMLHGWEDKPGYDFPLLGSDDRLHPNFRQVGARTGRMSCSEPNMQNWHRDNLSMRYLVKAEEGKKLVSVDLDGIEMRLFAAFAGSGAMSDLIHRGEDVHAYTAKMMGLRDRQNPDGSIESARQQGKTYNYSLQFGAGVRQIRKSFRVSQDQARSMKDRYDAAFPEIAELQNRIEFALVDRGYIKTPWGRRHRVERNAEQEAYKFVGRLIQGTAADLFKDALVTIHKAGVPIIGVVHDEVLAEVDEADAEEAGRIISAALTDHDRITRKMPLEAEAQILDRWSDAKQPGFKPDYAP